MKKIFISLILAFLIVSLLFAQGDSCYDNAVNWLKSNFPAGYKVAQKTDRNFFSRWLDCSKGFLIFSVNLAVHESVHLLSFSQSSVMQTFYVLPGRYQNINRSAHTYFPKTEINRYLTSSDRDWYYQTYLTGQNGSQGFNLLLEELNAYTWSVKINTIIASKQGIPGNIRIGERDSLATFMLYTALYIKHARVAHPSVYSKMSGSSELKKTLKVIWTNAENILAEAKRFPNLGMNDASKINRLNQVVNEVKILIAKPDTNTSNEENTTSSTNSTERENTTNSDPSENYSDTSEGILLTEKLIIRYLNTFPDYYNLLKKLQSVSDNSSISEEEKANEVREIGVKRNDLILNKGWANEEEYNNTYQKIQRYLTPIYLKLKFSRLNPDMARRAEETFSQQLKGLNRAEITVLTKYAEKIRAMYVSVGLIGAD